MRTQSGRRQRGAALILFATVLVLGVAWFAVGALGKAAPTTAERDIKTGAALFAAKRALLSYVAQYAARTDHSVPGRLPCPESLSPAAGEEGDAENTCSNATVRVGRFPWRTVGIEQPRDGYGETLWYVLGPGFRSSPVNFGSTGQLTVDGVANAAVALIIAPGTALNNLAEPGTPASPCVKQNQATNRYTTPYSLANFAECFDTASSPASFVTTASSSWFNDRVITITANDVMDAIAGPVADRLQRQVAAVLGDWHQVELTATGKSWAATHGMSFLPYASTWGNPTTTNYCGNQGEYYGLAPVDATCYNNAWTGSATVVGLLNFGCDDPSGTYLRCRFFQIFGTPPFSAQITATADNVARAFRSTISVSDLTITGGGSATMSMSLPAGTSDATATIDVSWPATLTFGTLVEVRIPHLQDAAVLSDTRFTWFWDNQWHQYTHYAIAPGAAAPGTSACTPGTSCLTASGLPTSTGNTDDKRLVLVLSGRPLAGKTHPSSLRADYFESENSTPGDEEYVSATVTSSFNDRIAACPFQQTTTAGTVSICN